MAISETSQGGTQASSYAEEQENAVIAGVSGKKVFVVDSSGNQISDFGAKYSTNNLDETTTTGVTYVGQEDKDGNYKILKLDETGDLVITYATIANNPSVTTYASAWSARATTLVYNIFSTAL